MIVDNRLSNKGFSSEIALDLAEQADQADQGPGPDRPGVHRRDSPEGWPRLPGSSGQPGPAGGSRHLLINCHHINYSTTDSRLGDILGEIYHNPVMNQYYDEVVQFVSWIRKTIDIKIRMKGYTHFPCGYEDWDQLVPFTQIEYSKNTATRYSYDYVKIILNRCYKLQDWLRGRPCVMGAFTVPHEYNRFGQLKNPGMDHMACLLQLKKAWRLFTKRMHKRYGESIPYLYLYEAHEQGYPHFHAVLVGDFTDADLEWFKRAWADCIGYPEHADVALEFSDLREMEYPVAYLMKYLWKTLWQNYTDWSAGDWVLNALLWKTGTRSYQPSQNLQSIMKADRRQAPDTDVYTHILADGIPRKSGVNQDLPVVIATPKRADDAYTADAVRNPDIAPFIPIRASPALLAAFPLSDRLKSWLSQHPEHVLDDGPQPGRRGTTRSEGSICRNG